MTDKQSITFNNNTIFEKFYRTVTYTDCIIIRMITDNQLNLDGSLNDVTNITTKQLWSYIYYIWQQNHEKDGLIFYEMTSRTQNSIKPSASLFIDKIIEYLKGKNHRSSENFPTINKEKFLIKEDLIAFLKFMYEDEQWKDIEIPVLTNLYERIIERVENESLDTDEVRSLMESNHNLKFCATIEDEKINIKQCE